MIKNKKTKILKFNKMLKSWHGADATTISFTDSHFNMLAIKLVDPVNKKIFGVGFSKCTYISGLASWSGAILDITYDEDHLLYVISDKNSKFLVKCVDLLMRDGIGDEYKLGIVFKNDFMRGMSEKKIENNNKKLREWDGGKASFAMYTNESTNMLMINISGAVKGEGVSVGFTKCTFLAGPVKWKNIEINLESKKDGSGIIATDKNAGFCVKCEDVFIGVDLDEVLN